MKISKFLLQVLLLAAIPQVLPLPFILPEVLDALRSSNKIAKFIKYLGIPSPDLCHPSKEKGLIPMRNPDLLFGDLLIDEVKDKDKEKKDLDTANTLNDFASSSSTSSSKSRGEIKKWKNGIIPYYISNEYSSSDREKIEEAISSMNSELSKVELRPFNSLLDKNYVHIFSGKGCYAKLGMAGGPQPVSLQADECLNNGIIQHELTHAIGFSHEQNRPDRDNYIKLIFENIPEKWINDYKQNNPSNAAFVGDYDYYSVMHYPPQSPVDKNKETFTVLDDTVSPNDIGNKNRLSEKDIQKIEEFYSETDEES